MLRTLTDETFKEKIRESTETQIIYFSAPWCKPCEMFGPTVEIVSGKHPHIEFYKANMEECGNIANELNIRSLPSVIMFDGGMLRHLHIGTMTAEQFRIWIQENI